jgi:hypothetical protein
VDRRVLSRDTLITGAPPVIDEPHVLLEEPQPATDKSGDDGGNNEEEATTLSIFFVDR